MTGAITLILGSDAWRHSLSKSGRSLRKKPLKNQNGQSVEPIKVIAIPGNVQSARPNFLTLSRRPLPGRHLQLAGLANDLWRVIEGQCPNVAAADDPFVIDNEQPVLRLVAKVTQCFTGFPLRQASPDNSGQKRGGDSPAD